MNINLDKQSIVEKLAEALNVFGKAEVMIRFESDTDLVIKIISNFFEDIELLERVKLVSDAITDIASNELGDLEVSLIPLTESEASDSFDKF